MIHGDLRHGGGPILGDRPASRASAWPAPGVPPGTATRRSPGPARAARGARRDAASDPGARQRAGPGPDSQGLNPISPDGPMGPAAPAPRDRPVDRIPGPRRIDLRGRPSGGRALGGRWSPGRPAGVIELSRTLPIGDNIMEFVHEITAFLENKPGRLAKICSALAHEKVDLRALSVMDANGRSVLRFVTDHLEETRKVLTSLGTEFTTNEVLAVEMENRPGALARVLERLAEEHINIEYAYLGVLERAGPVAGDLPHLEPEAGPAAPGRFARQRGGPVAATSPAPLALRWRPDRAPARRRSVPRDPGRAGDRRPTSGRSAGPAWRSGPSSGWSGRSGSS